MFRYQLHVQVRAGQWREYYSGYEKLEQLSRAKNLVPSQLWGVSFGPINQAVIVADYETMEAFDRDGKAFESDPDIMKVWRGMAEHQEGIPWGELWESAHQVA